MTVPPSDAEWSARWPMTPATVVDPRLVEERLRRENPIAPERGDWRTFLGNTIRVLDGQGTSVMGEGVVVAVCEVPTLVVRAADGTISHHATSLPIEVMEWRRL